MYESDFEYAHNVKITPKNDDHLCHAIKMVIELKNIVHIYLNHMGFELVKHPMS